MASRITLFMFFPLSRAPQIVALRDQSMR